MNCDHCDTNEATVHETVIENGKIVEKHLCESCAAEQGFAVKVPGSVEEIIKKVLPGSQTTGLATATPRCHGCGMTFADFAQKRLLGCAACYESFETQLGVLIEREHEGATHHVGKVPRRARGETRMVADPDEGQEEDTVSLQDELARLRQMLSEAVRREEYEHAAELHKQISRLATEQRSAAESGDEA